MTSSLQDKNSRYVSGGLSETNGTAIEWWERAVFPTFDDDSEYIVEKRFEGRLDLISAIQLGDSKYWWILAQYNNVLDPVAEITEGVILRVPTVQRVQSILDGRTGGVASTRVIPTTVLPIV